MPEIFYWSPKILLWHKIINQSVFDILPWFLLVISLHKIFIFSCPSSVRLITVFSLTFYLLRFYWISHLFFSPLLLSWSLCACTFKNFFIDILMLFREQMFNPTCFSSLLLTLKNMLFLYSDCPHKYSSPSLFALQSIPSLSSLSNIPSTIS